MGIWRCRRLAVSIWTCKKQVLSTLRAVGILRYSSGILEQAVDIWSCWRQALGVWNKQCVSGGI